MLPIPVDWPLFNITLLFSAKNLPMFSALSSTSLEVISWEPVTKIQASCAFISISERTLAYSDTGTTNSRIPSLFNSDIHKSNRTFLWLNDSSFSPSSLVISHIKI